MRSLIVLSAIFAVTFATLGVDMSTAVSKSNWQCLKNSGYTFGIVRCYRSTGSTDPNCPATMKNAWAGGMSHVDAYIFPCPRCGNPAAQVRAMVSYLRSNGVKFGMIWLDIEGKQYWPGSQATNRNFLQGMMNEAKRLGVNYGIYSSASQWAPIMGSWTGASSRPLWYAHYDGKPNFSDFRPFGGWKRPAMKQYVGDVRVCGVGIDKNWY